MLGYALSAGVAGGPLRPLYDPISAGDEPEPERRNFTVVGLPPRTSFSFAVAASNAAGRGRFSEQATFATTAIAPTVSAAEPLFGPAHGGTRVRVHGAGVVPGT